MTKLDNYAIEFFTYFGILSFTILTWYLTVEAVILFLKALR